MGANNTEGTHSIRSRVGLLAAALVIVATACACQQTTPAAEGPWAADIEQARSEWASNEFVQSVLADSSISEAELQDMRQRVISCLTDKGVTGASFGPSGTLSVPISRLAPPYLRNSNKNSSPPVPTMPVSRSSRHLSSTCESTRITGISTSCTRSV